MGFLTTGKIAQETGEDLCTVSYALRRLRIQPLGRAGQVRIFPESAINQVREFLASKPHRNKPTTREA